ncbi:MAG: type II toxin-antitoxin system PemK/MazF family toxin [Caldilineaceae bacterium]
MKRGEIYRIAKPPGGDPKQFRYFVIVSRPALIDRVFQPLSARRSTPCTTVCLLQVAVGIDEGLKHDSSIHCDALMSIPKSMLTNYVGSLSDDKIAALHQALLVALELDIDL